MSSSRFEWPATPPRADGPLAGITIDTDSLVGEYCKAMGWDPGSRHPESETVEKLGLRDLVGE